MNVTGKILVINDTDAPAHYLTHINCLIGIFGSLPFWIKSKHSLLGVFISYIKLSIFIYVSFNLWHFHYIPKMVYTSSIYIYWFMPPFLLSLIIFEKLLLNKYIIKA